MDKARLLKYYLYVFGFLSVFLFSFTTPLLFGDLLLWPPRNIPTEMMLSGMYLVMGIIMIIAAKKPLSHKTFIDFVVLSNIIHAIVMIIYARNIFHLAVDALSVGLMGILPLFFYPWGLRKFLRY